MILYFKDRIIKWCLASSLLLNFLLWLLFYFRIPIQVEPIVLRYNIYVGINLIGSWFAIFYLPLVGLGIIILNFLLAGLIYKKDRLPAHFLAVTAMACQMILLVTGVLLVMMNGWEK